PRLAGDRVPGGAEITDGCPWRQPQVVEVAVAVAGDLVARLDDAACRIRRAAHLLTDDEEGGHHVELPERLEETVDGAGLRAVVEGEPDTAGPVASAVEPAGRPEEAAPSRHCGEHRQGMTHGEGCGGGRDHPDPGN